MNTSNQPENPELQEILAFLRGKLRGAKISEIEVALGSHMSRRTLARRLVALKEIGLVSSAGEKRGTRYFTQVSEELLELSPAGLSLKQQVRRPPQQRTPVPYKPDFLYDYQPNHTFYLSESVREHLMQIGRAFDHDLEPGTYAKRILHRLLIDLSWNSSRLEGNTYSLLETERLIEFGAEAEGKNAFEAQMILNHKEAIEFLVEVSGPTGISQHLVLNTHALLSNNLLGDPKARGRLRQIPVGIGGTVYQPPEIPQLIEECFRRLLETAVAIQDPFEQAFFLMVQLPYLQPFEDVNKRVSRLVANVPLIRSNLSPLSFIDVPQEDYISGLLAVYELNRVELLRDVLVWAYERSAQQYRLVQETLGQPNLIHMRYRRELSELVNLIVANNLKGKKIVETVQDWTLHHIGSDDRPEFIRLAESEIAGLHEGNFSVYHIDPDLFERWRSH